MQAIGKSEKHPAETAGVRYGGWEELGRRIPIRCFDTDPSIPSSLKFLRKTPWAREKVERLYISTLKKAAQEEAMDA